MLMVLALVTASMRPHATVEFTNNNPTSSMIACHEALIQYFGANPSVTGAISASAVDAYLPAGLTDPGTFSYRAVAPGTVATYLTTPVSNQALLIQIVQRLSNYGLLAGPVTGGQIVPILPNTPVAAIAGVPNGTIAIQTVLLDN